MSHNSPRHPGGKSSNWGICSKLVTPTEAPFEMPFLLGSFLHGVEGCNFRPSYHSDLC
jgi:hypothetical protein